MGYNRKRKWYYESVKEEANKYKSRSEFQKRCESAYKVARKNGWLDDFNWLVRPKRKVKWDYDSIKEEARKYKTITEFSKGSCQAYKVARKNGWMADFDWLKDRRFDLFNDKIDCVYAYEFLDFNSVYVGRTLMRLKKQRDLAHIFVKNDTVAIFAKQNDVAVPKPKILEENLTIEEGSKREGYWLQWYIDNGWNGLNRAKTGSIGGLGKGKWKYESVKKEATKYKSRNDFYNGNNSAYCAAIRNGWLDDWFGYRYKSWDYESVKDEAIKYKSRTEFKNGCESAYQIARNNGWLGDWFGYLNKSWDYESVKEEASKYKSRNDFYKGNRNAYSAAIRNGWIDDWFGYLNKSWDYDSVKEESSKYKSRTEFCRGSQRAYNTARKNGWLDDFSQNKFPK